MTIGQITISAADWMASNVSDRMELLAIAARQSAAEPVAAPAETGQGTTNNQHRDRERSILAAQENYKRVAARIKARLAAPDETEARAAIPASEDQTRKSVIESLEKSPSLAAALIADTQRAGLDTKPSSPVRDADKQSVTASAREIPAPDEENRPVFQKAGPTEQPSDRRNGFEELYPKGLWRDLFVDRNGSDAAPDLTQ